MIPEVFECPRCERQFVVDGIPDTGSEEVHCPQCSRYLGVRDIAFVLRAELDELIERLTLREGSPGEGRGRLRIAGEMDRAQQRIQRVQRYLVTPSHQ